MSKKKKEQDVQAEIEIVEATIFRAFHNQNLLIALGPDRRLYRFTYPKNSVFCDWEEGMLVRIYYRTDPLEPVVETMEEV